MQITFKTGSILLPHRKRHGTLTRRYFGKVSNKAPVANAAEVHKLLLVAKISIIEGLVLKNIEAGNYEMMCLPLKIKGAVGTPAQVIIRKV